MSTTFVLHISSVCCRYAKYYWKHSAEYVEETPYQWDWVRRSLRGNECPPSVAINFPLGVHGRPWKLAERREMTGEMLLIAFTAALFRRWRSLSVCILLQQLATATWKQQAAPSPNFSHIHLCAWGRSSVVVRGPILQVHLFSLPRVGYTESLWVTVDHQRRCYNYSSVVLVVGGVAQLLTTLIGSTKLINVGPG